MITPRRLPGSEVDGYGGNLMGAGPKQPPPMGMGKGAMGGGQGQGLPPNTPLPPLSGGLPQDPMSTINPMNAQSYLGLQRRRLGV